MAPTIKGSYADADAPVGFDLQQPIAGIALLETDESKHVPSTGGFDHGDVHRAHVYWAGNPIEQSMLQQPTSYMENMNIGFQNQPTGFQNGLSNESGTQNGRDFHVQQQMPPQIPALKPIKLEEPDCDSTSNMIERMVAYPLHKPRGILFDPIHEATQAADDQFDSKGPKLAKEEEQISPNPPSIFQPTMHEPLNRMLPHSSSVEPSFRRSHRDRSSVSTYNIKALAGTAIHTNRKYSKDHSAVESLRTTLSSDTRAQPGSSLAGTFELPHNTENHFKASKQLPSITPITLQSGPGRPRIGIFDRPVKKENEDENKNEMQDSEMTRSTAQVKGNNFRASRLDSQINSSSEENVSQKSFDHTFPSLSSHDERYDWTSL